MSPADNPLVFVVDDSPTLRDLVAHTIRQLGCTPMTFDTGDACIRALEHHRPFLILMDFEMMPMRGDEACWLIKETPATAGIPVVMMTSTESSQDVMSCWQVGADDFLPKPIRRAQLASKIERLRQAGADLDRGLYRKLLLVTPERRMREEAGKALEYSGYRMFYASSASEAAVLLSQRPESIDGIVLHLGPPWEPGVSLLRTARSGEAYRPKPVLALSDVPPPPELKTELVRLLQSPVHDRSECSAELLLSRVHLMLRRITLDLRATKRAPFFSVVEFRARGSGEWQSGFSSDISLGGIFVRTLTPCPPATELELKVNFGGRPVLCSGMVAWSNPLPRVRDASYPIGMGIKFTSIAAEQAEEIERLIEPAPAPSRPQPEHDLP